MIDDEKIQKLNDLHEQAMEYMDLAFIERRKRNKAKAKEIFRKSFELERAAAKLLENDLDFEPMRAVLYRSAATLAVDCGETEEAKILINIGLSVNAPIEIASELKELLSAIENNDLTYTDSSLLLAYKLISQEKETRDIVRKTVVGIQGYAAKVAMLKIQFSDLLGSLSSSV